MGDVTERRWHWPDLTDRPRVRLLVDALVVLAMAIGTAAVTQRWTGLHLDGMFYATLGLNGHEVTDRAVIDSYYWTRLGYIAPVHGLTSILGPWAGLEAWRVLLLTGLAGGFYAIATRYTRRLLAAPVVLMVLLDSVLILWMGQTYLTGTILAATAITMAAAMFPGWRAHLLSGITLGWLTMVYPPGFLIAASIWVALRIHAGIRWRGMLITAASAAATFLAFLAIGLVMFPGKNWLGTYLEWTDKLNFADYASKTPVWLTDISMLVPALVLLIALGAWINDRTQESSQKALIVSLTSIGAQLTLGRVLGGYLLEAPLYQAILWPPALASLVLVVSGRMSDRSPRPWPTGITAVAGIAAVLVAGHFTGIVTFGWGIVLALLAVAVMILCIWLARRVKATVAVIALLLGLALVLSTAQVLQNSRRTIGLYPTTPYSWAFVANPVAEKVRASVNAEEWLLANTSSSDQILNWVGGDWVGGDRELYMLAGMQFWGENRVTLEPVLTPDDVTRLQALRPSVIQMVAPEMDQIARFWGSLPPATRPTAPVCYDFAWPAPTFPVGHSCLTRLDWSTP